MKMKEAIWGGALGGAMFGVMQAFIVGPAGGLFMGLFFGVSIALLVYLFANSNMIKKQIALSDDLLLPGEKILLTKPANLVIVPKDFGLDRFAFDGILWTVGMKNKESLGGALHLTNYRIIFKSHRYNRLRGMTSIFLPTIEQLENRTVLVFRKLAVATTTTKVEFVIGDVDDVIDQITAARQSLDEATLETIKKHAVDHPEKCNDALQQWDALVKLNSLFNLGKKTTSAAQAVVNPLGVLGSTFMSELLDKTLAEKWQEVHQIAERRSASRSAERPAA